METDIKRITCCICYIPFWITNAHNNRLLSCHNDFYCPNGHCQSYTGESDRDKLKRAEQNLEGERQYANSLARSNSALRGVITKMKKKK